MTDNCGKRFRLYRPGRERHDDWYWLPFPDDEMGMVSVAMISSIFWKGKFHCIYLSKGLIVVDTLPVEPTVEFLEMDQSQLPVIGNRSNGFFLEDRMELFLVESDGKLLLVVEFFDYDPPDTSRWLTGFQVFEADFSERKRWVRVESLGDRVLFIYRNFAASLSAADVGVEGNCIYCIDPSKTEPVPWSVFDLSTGRVTDASLPCPPSPSAHLMFVPSIC